MPENQSLKGKRQLLKSLLARLHNRYNVSAAEIGDHDSWQMISLGITCVSNEERHASQVMASVISFIESQRLDAELLDYETEVIQA